MKQKHFIAHKSPDLLLLFICSAFLGIVSCFIVDTVTHAFVIINDVVGIVSSFSIGTFLAVTQLVSLYMCDAPMNILTLTYVYSEHLLHHMYSTLCNNNTVWINALH